MKDSFGREHRDLRISLTDKCNLRCQYCMPEDFQQWLPQANQLTTAELEQITRIAVELGITEVRLTGGEPLLRGDLVEIVHAISSIEGIEDLSLTTNGVGLAAKAQALRNAGLKRLNISLDTLKSERFKEITKRDKFTDVLAGIAAAKSAGFSPIKINTVLLEGINDDEVLDLVEWAFQEGLQLRFIEQMPLDAGDAWNRKTMITAAQIHSAINEKYQLEALPNRGAAPAETFRVVGRDQTIGIIASITQPFCGNCDRLRLTSDGYLRNCLFAREEMHLTTILRDADKSIEEKLATLRERFESTVSSKWAGHQVNTELFIKPTRPMSAIGG